MKGPKHLLIAILVNGLACKNPSMIQANDFFFTRLHIAGNTSNIVGSRVTLVSVTQRTNYSMNICPVWVVWSLVLFYQIW